MKQAHRTNRRTASNRSLIIDSLRELIPISFFFVGLYLFVSLLTYNVQDSIWSAQDETYKITNEGGWFGASFADMFIYLFGYFAYLFPFMVGYLGWIIYQGEHRNILAEPKSLILPSAGFVLTLSAGCGLAIVHFAAESSLLPTHAGGILGIFVGKSLESIFSQLGATLLLLALFFTGVTLLTGLSWLKLMDILGFHTLRWSPVVKKYIKTQLLPIVTVYLRSGFTFTQKILAFFLQQLRIKIKAFQAFWQARREEWRERREYFEEDDEDYFYEEDPLLDEEAQQLFKKNLTEEKPELEEDDSVILQPTTPLLPALDLLEPVPDGIPISDTGVLTQLLTETFQQLQIESKINAVHSGPVLTSFEIESITPIRMTEIEAINDLLTKQVAYVRIQETMPKTFTIEMPNPQRQPIYLRELLSCVDYQDSFSPLTVALGKDSNGQPVVIDLTRIPHILIAGNDPNERSTAIDTLLLSLIYKSTPTTLRLLLIDSTSGDLAVYEQLPHLLNPIISEPKSVLRALKWCDQEMERRYRLMSSKGMRTIENYNQALLNPSGKNPLEEVSTDALPYVVIVIHEIAEITKTPESIQIEEIIMRLTQRARAAGIHLILATQYPSVNVITGLLKTNIPTRIAFQVTTKSESRAILGQMGAETLLGEGDMLYITVGTGIPIRIHGGFVSRAEVSRVVTDLKVRGTENYIDLSH